MIESNGQTLSWPVKHYNSVKTLEGKHPLLSLIKRSERDGFINALKSSGVNNFFRLKEILQVSNIEHHYINQNSQLDKVVTIKQAAVSIANNELELITLKLDNDFTNTLMQQIRKLIIYKQLVSKNNDYSNIFAESDNNIFGLYWKLRNPYIVNLFYAISYGLIGILIILLFNRIRLLNSK